MTQLVRLDGSAAASPWVDSAVVFGMFVGTFVLAFWIYDHMPSESVAIALKVIPYAVIFAFVVWRRYLGRPFFPIGSPALVFWRRHCYGCWRWECSLHGVSAWRL